MKIKAMSKHVGGRNWDFLAWTAILCSPIFSCAIVLRTNGGPEGIKLQPVGLGLWPQVVEA